VGLARAAPRPFPATTARIAVFNDQLNVSAMTAAQLDFAARNYVGTQKVTRREARLLRAINPAFLVLHCRLAQALGHSVPDGACRPTERMLQIVRGDSWAQEWPGDATIVDSWLWRWQGERVIQCTWGNYLADLDDPAWREWWADQVITELALNEDDGLFADSFSVPNYFGACSWRPCLPAAEPSPLELDRAYRRVLPDGGGLVPPDGAAPVRLVEEAVAALTLPAHGAAVLYCVGPCPTP
jgi:hypothetical protein